MIAGAVVITTGTAVPIRYLKSKNLDLVIKPMIHSLSLKGLELSLKLTIKNPTFIRLKNHPHIQLLNEGKELISSEVGIQYIPWKNIASLSCLL